MAQLRYKPENINPQGKPRVYFACHEQDFKGHFQTVSDEILKSSSCVIYYYDEAPELDEDYFLNLSRMNLIVMPVTSRLLYLPNRAMDVEFGYAMDHHIPVLPLMYESGLEEKYKEKFGDLQFLNKYDPDPTALPYADKLKKYLEAVLIGDELAAKVRAAFDAYIFLSYRKKDRKLAQELMKLIHKNPLCRDIAIWYDEFLTPGESFNDAIRAALEKSDLFVLAVTPNLINEINYVMTVEYPMAMEAGKPILPAEMEPTDPAGLSASYEGIPESVNPQDEEAMLARLRALATQKNDADPTHNFFIGLAYLSGIDVEVDHDYAVKLITAAAETGLTIAIKKLASMYETGEGIERDYLMAISWLEKLVAGLKSRYDMTDAKQDGYLLASCFLKLIHLLHLLSQWKRAEPFCQQLRLLAEKMAVEYGGNVEVSLQQDSYSRLGDNAVGRGDIPSGEYWYGRSLELCRNLAKNGSQDALRSVSICYERLGDCARNRQKMSRARDHYLICWKIRQQLVKDGTEQAMLDLAGIYLKLADLAERRHQFKEALLWATHSLPINRKLAQYGTPEHQRSLSLSYFRLGKVFERMGEQDKAKGFFAQCMKIQRVLAAAETLQALRDLAVCCNVMGDLARKMGETALADERYAEAVALHSRLTEKFYTVQSSLELAAVCYKLGKLRGSRELLQKALGIFCDLMERHPGMTHLQKNIEIVQREIEKLESNT